MLNIDKSIFLSNLRLTREYCDLQLSNTEKSIAEILRSYNPVVTVERADSKQNAFISFLNNLIKPKSRNHLFSFDQGYRVRNIAYAMAWSIDPLDSNTIKNLFKEQLAFKQERTKSIGNKSYEGAILVCHIDQTTVDGASEAESIGFIDVYDLPPIDTWFYLTKHKNENILFAWIPKDFMQLANDGILVNCVECFTWFEDTYHETHEALGLHSYN